MGEREYIMAYKFEIGTSFKAPKDAPAMYFTVRRKTNCFVWLDTDGLGDNVFQKKIRYDVEGNEYVELTNKDFVTLYWKRYVFAKEIFYK